MPSTFTTVEVSVDEAAALWRVQPQTILRRLRSKELRRGAAPNTVSLDPGRTWVRVEDAAVMLGVTPATVRACISRGELAGRKERGGRWRVRLESVLADRRCDPTAAARFGGDTVPRDPPARRPAAEGAFRRMVLVRLDADESELLAHVRDRYGSQQAAIVAGLRAAEAGGATPSEVAELRVEHDLYRDEARAARERAALLAELARERLVDELWCPRCERLVPIEEAGYAVDEDSGVVELFHDPHGHHRAGRMRPGTVMARRRPLERDDET